MKKFLFLTVLVVAIVALAAGTAFAGSWWVVNSNASGDVPKWNSNNPTTGYGAGSLSWSLDFNDPNGNADPSRAVSWYYRNNGSTSEIAKRLGINSSDDNGTDNRDTLSSGTPHGGFSTTTGYCKTCHAVHEAGESSYRLLKNGGAFEADGDISFQGATGKDRSSGEGLIAGPNPLNMEGPGKAAAGGMGNARSNECMYCHDADSGFSPMRPYALSVITIVRGEHTVGATHIPDRDGTEMSRRDPFDGRPAYDVGVLQCYQCHSVHGANTLGTLTSGSNAWSAVILRLDPNGDGDKLAQTVVGAPVVGGSAGNGLFSMGFETAVRTAFCADCHRANPNWSTGGEYVNGVWKESRARNNSHVQGPNADGLLEVYGATTRVASTDLALDGVGASTATVGNKARDAKNGCRGCHSADDTGTEQKEINGVQSTWPHQSIGPKLLNDLLALPNASEPGSGGYDVGGDQNIAGITGDADRSLTNMDAICLRCHSKNRIGGVQASHANDIFGVGWSF